MTTRENEGGEWYEIDTRPIDYSLSLSPTERLQRCELEVALMELMKLADTAALTDAVATLRASYERNPFVARREMIWIQARS